MGIVMPFSGIYLRLTAKVSEWMTRIPLSPSVAVYGTVCRGSYEYLRKEVRVTYMQSIFSPIQ
jgi:hypothetical protein